ncbi:MAG: DUF4054 domain-containing protein [Acidiferrobacterales bacterium]|nr:DUF4054 domain-containing protein [Acidiferrobacterales bacterium]
MEITAQIIADFRAWYPEFASAVDYPDATLTRSLCIADHETGSKRWGVYDYAKCKIKTQGLFAYAAHYTAMRDLTENAAAGGVALSPTGTVSGKSVGDESISYAVASPSSLAEQAQYGDLNATTYGQEFLRLRRRVSMGAIVV